MPSEVYYFFSGYADFEYAKRALKYGVSNYLTKPLDENELTEALQTVTEQILKERKASSRREALSALMQEDTVSRLLMRENTEEEREQGLKTLGIAPRLAAMLYIGPWTRAGQLAYARASRRHERQGAAAQPCGLSVHRRQREARILAGVPAGRAGA
ncbi:hypothetical protein ACFTAO_15930 [Paenibacillus rhizoplanae]